MGKSTIRISCVLLVYTS